MPTVWKLCRILKKETSWVRNYILLRKERSPWEKSLKSQRWLYLHNYIFQYCCINMFCRNGTMLVCTFLLRCSVTGAYPGIRIYACAYWVYSFRKSKSVKRLNMQYNLKAKRGRSMHTFEQYMYRHYLWTCMLES